MSDSASRSFFADLPPADRVRDGSIDIHRPGRPAGPAPAVVFVHGGPISPDGPRPRDSAVFTGYGALAAASGLVGITFDHRLYGVDNLPLASDDVARAVDQARARDEVDAGRVALWFFSGGGPLATGWLRDPPPWLRCLAWTYPLIGPTPDWPTSMRTFDPTTALANALDLPQVMVRVGHELPFIVPTQDAYLDEARRRGVELTVLDIPHARHGFEVHGPDADARRVVDQALARIAGLLSELPGGIAALRC